MRNHETRAAWDYHNATKHSLHSVQTSRHMLDWANQPIPYKRYRDLTAIPLPRDLPGSRIPALNALAGERPAAGAPRDLDLALLASILHHTAGITKRLRIPGGFMDFRAAACTGALYHIDFYVVCGPLAGLEAGVYHFSVQDFALRRLRSGDFRGVLAEATAAEPAVTPAPAILVATSTYWRNAWKYEERTYRHCYWDLGPFLANLLAVSAAHDLPARVLLGFVDGAVNRLVDVDGEREAALAVVPLGLGAEDIAPFAPEPPVLALPVLPDSDHEIDYPAIRVMHAASSLQNAEEVTAWRAAAEEEPDRATTPAIAGLPLPHGIREGQPTDPIETVIRKRGSSRGFRTDPISNAQLGTMLHAASRGIPADFARGRGSELTQAYVIANAVDGLPSGSYAYDPDQHALRTLAEGAFRERAGYLALTQQLAADAAVNVYFLADLMPALERLGNRGYRAAQLEASITAGKLYLAAYCLGLGASGLTFFDDDVTGFFAPHAAGKSGMFLITIGQPLRRQAQA